MSDPDEVIERVRALIPTTALSRVEFLEVSAQRLEGEAAPAQQTFPVAIELGYQLIGDEFVAYRFRVSVDRPDLGVAPVLLGLLVLKAARRAAMAQTEPTAPAV